MKERLTKKEDDHYEVLSNRNFAHGGYFADNYYSKLDEAIDKLGQYEDIEEEYNIDIVEAVNLCKKANKQKVVYVKESWGIDTINLLDDLDVEIFNHRLYSNARCVYISLDILEYNKTWALNREELK